LERFEENRVLLTKRNFGRCFADVEVSFEGIVPRQRISHGVANESSWR
jgi:hypothetical protein